MVESARLKHDVQKFLRGAFTEGIKTKEKKIQIVKDFKIVQDTCEKSRCDKGPQSESLMSHLEFAAVTDCLTGMRLDWSLGSDSKSGRAWKRENHRK